MSSFLNFIMVFILASLNREPALMNLMGLCSLRGIRGLLFVKNGLRWVNSPLGVLFTMYKPFLT